MRAALWIALSAASSCGGETQARSDSLLVGRWEWRPEVDERLLEDARRSGGDPREVVRALSEAPAPLAITFDADGAWTMEGTSFDDPFRDTARWSVVEERFDTIAVALVRADRVDPERMTFTVLAPDRIRLEGPRVGGTLFVRAD